jgi:flagellar hook-associated protein 3 FlgL
MINSINSSADNFLVNIGRIQARAESAQRQLSSGLRVSQPSDDPDQVGNILQLSSTLARNDQIGHNLDQVKSEVDTGEQTLSQAVSTLEQASVIGAQAANFTASASTRAGLASQVQDLLDRLIASANSSVGGRYIFGGDTDQVPPYGLDLTSATGTTPYAGSAATRQVEHPRGGTFPVSQNAQQIFDGPGAASAFGAVNSLRVALLANDQAGIDASLMALKTAHDHLGESLSFYGSIQNEVNSAISDVKTTGLRLLTNLSALRDADLVGASIDLNNAKLSLDAAFSARARVPPTSLFDFLR